MITNLGREVFIDFEPDEFRLTNWSKFRPVPTSPGNNIWAETSTDGRAPTFEVAVDGSDVVVTRVQGHVVINRGRSWVVRGHESNELLEHEQGHYYITYIPYVRMLQAIRDLRVSHSPAVNLPAGHHRQTAMHNAITRLVQPLLSQAQARMSQLTRDYDALTPPGTDHSRNRIEQQAWNNRFAASLASGAAL
jgi:hypothetical protein